MNAPPDHPSVKDGARLSRVWQTILWQATVTVAVLVVAVVLIFGWKLVTRDEPFEPISFVNPALVVFGDGTIPSVPGVEGPAVSLGVDGSGVVPLRWVELNTSAEPVEAVFAVDVVSFQRGLSISIRSDSVRPPFEPGVVVYHTERPIYPQVATAALEAAESGVCVTEWTVVASATPLREGGVAAQFWSENYSIVVEGCVS